MATLITIVTVVVAVALIAWFVANRKTPARSDRESGNRIVTESDRFYSKVDRPAGPDAESMDPDVMLGHPEPPRRP
jgi:hypothetical protein